VLGGYLQTRDRAHLDSGVQEVDPLGDLQVTPGRAVEGLEIRIRLLWFTCTVRSVSEAPIAEVPK
jgi:hypothetical protein